MLVSRTILAKRIGICVMYYAQLYENSFLPGANSILKYVFRKLNKNIGKIFQIFIYLFI